MIKNKSKQKIAVKGIWKVEQTKTHLIFKIWHSCNEKDNGTYSHPKLVTWKYLKKLPKTEEKYKGIYIT